MSEPQSTSRLTINADAPVRWLLAVGVILLLLGVMLGVISHDDCGSVFNPSDRSLFDAMMRDSGYQSSSATSCAATLSHVKPWMFLCLGFGALALIAELTVMRLQPRPGQPTED